MSEIDGYQETTEDDRLICPNPRCGKDLRYPWENYKVGNGYACPYCAYNFTTDDVQVNAIDVTGVHYTDMVVFFDKDTYEVKAKFFKNHFFTKGGRLWVHVPSRRIKNTKMIALSEEWEPMLDKIAQELKEEAIEHSQNKHRPENKGGEMER
jgi:hypothetical protein